MRNKKLIAGNWKMNGFVADGTDRTRMLAEHVRTAKSHAFEMVLCPPATLIQQTAHAVAGTGIAVGGQDCHAQPSGAFTGDISAMMLKNIDCTYVILGHSERRHFHRETSHEVNAKAKAAHAAGLTAIICVGETDAEREAGKANDIVSGQLAESVPHGSNATNTVIAYEPVWAIGTGKVASEDDIKNMHAHIRAKVGNDMRVLYGGSVKASNAREILHLANVDGVLVGGASLKVEEFWAIAEAATK